MFEVKEMSEDDNLQKEQFAVSSRTVGDHVRRKITEAKSQIQFGANLGLPSVMLIYNDIDLRFGTEDRDFWSAMYGEHTVRIEVNSRKITDSYSGRNKSFMESKNTSFSAVGRLFRHPRSDNIEVTLFENIFAKIPLPYERLPLYFEVASGFRR